MPRQARIVSPTGVYHIIMRGNERRQIFYENKDRYRFYDIIRNSMELFGFEIYCYCFMSNHVHLIIRDKLNNISKLMHFINAHYANFFNKKYERTGHLFQDRFRSQIIETKSYLLSAIRYIHNNPVKANIVGKAEKFLWSSYREYIGKSSYYITKTDFILNLFSKDKNKALSYFLTFSHGPDNIILDDIDNVYSLVKKNYLEDIVKFILDEKNISLQQFNNWNHLDQSILLEIMDELKMRTRLSGRKITKLTGLKIK